MEASNMIDMSLDEIIKLNKKANKPNPKKLSVKPLALSTKRAGSLRSSIAKPMKSRQASAARAIFQRARRTAAIAAKVAADAAALVSPAVSIPNLRRGGPTRAVPRINRAINRNLAVRQRILAVNRQIFQRQSRRVRGVGVVNRLGIQSQRQQVQRQRLHKRLFSRNNNNVSIMGRNTQWSRQNQVENIDMRFINRMDDQRPSFNRRGRQVARTQMNGSLSSSQYQQYLQQARALIRAQEERQNVGNRSRGSNSIYIDVPTRNGGGFKGNRFNGRSGMRGRFRR